MSERYNRNGAGWAITWIGGLLFGLGISNITHAALDNSDQRVHDVQLYNHELYGQLTAGDRVVQDLILDDEKKRFSFHNEAEGACTGEYQLNANIAEVVGPLACTHTVPNPAHS